MFDNDGYILTEKDLLDGEGWLPQDLPNGPIPRRVSTSGKHKKD